MPSARPAFVASVTLAGMRGALRRAMVSCGRFQALTTLWGLGLKLVLSSAGLHAEAPDPQPTADAEPPVWKTNQDPVSRLWQRAGESGQPLQAISDMAWLTTVLKGLDIPVESQVLVFSKTSLQKAQISPAKPRALYYNEDCYIGWVQEGEMEVVAADPERGLQYYIIRRPFIAPARPQPEASNQCLSCHVGGSLQMQSVHTRESGYPIGQADAFVTSYESPLAERWGGWYVTGRHGHDLHMGNVFAYQRGGDVSLDRERGANVESLEDWVSTQPYAAATSDIVALMVLEHQYVMHNILHEANRSIRRVLNPPPGGPVYDEAARERILAKRAHEIVERLLFSGEYALRDGGVSGSPAFQTAFRRNARPDAQRRSLKDFNLKTRLFEHRCSYMIYSASFQGLPPPLKKSVYAELGAVLSDRSAGADAFGDIPVSERQAIRQILLETDPGARAAWADVSGQ